MKREDFFFSFDIKLVLRMKISKPVILQQVGGSTKEEFLKQPIGDFYGHEDMLIDNL